MGHGKSGGAAGDPITPGSSRDLRAPNTGQNGGGVKRSHTDSEQPGPSAGGVSLPVQSPDGRQDSSCSEGELSSGEEDVAPRRSWTVVSGMPAEGSRPGRPGKSLSNVPSLQLFVPPVLGSKGGQARGVLVSLLL